jgi:hypothetical protein
MRPNKKNFAACEWQKWAAVGMQNTPLSNFSKKCIFAQNLKSWLGKKNGKKVK